MMYPPIFEVAAASDAVKTLLGTNPVRLYPFGSAPQDVAKPYVTWQMVGGSPENYLGNRPDIDLFAIQIDVWADKASDTRAVAGALRDAIEPYAYITGYNGESRDSETLSYRYSFDVDWHVKR